MITSRQLEIQQNTRDWLELHFKGIFKEALFGNHWTLNADGAYHASLAACMCVCVCVCVCVYIAGMMNLLLYKADFRGLCLRY